MKILRCPQDFLDLAARSACSRAAGRAVQTGTYSPILNITVPGGNPGWRFTVTSQTGSKWLFHIELVEAERKYRVNSRKIR